VWGVQKLEKHVFFRQTQLSSDKNVRHLISPGFGCGLNMSLLSHIQGITNPETLSFSICKIVIVLTHVRAAKPKE